MAFSAQQGHATEPCDEVLSDKSKQLLSEAVLVLSPEESNAISKYSAGKGYEMNHYLRTNLPLRADNEPQIKELISAFKSALTKLPAFKGVVYRGAPLPASQFGRLTPVGLFDPKVLNLGAVISDPSFVSASTRISVVRDWYLPNHQDYGLFRIHSKTAKHLPGSLQVNGDGEQEVVFPPGTKFEVLAITEETGGLKIFDLQEVED